MHTCGTTTPRSANLGDCVALLRRDEANNNSRSLQSHSKIFSSIFCVAKRQRGVLHSEILKVRLTVVQKNFRCLHSEVVFIEDQNVMVRPNKSAKAIARFDREAEDEDELSFPEGAEITDIVKSLVVFAYISTGRHNLINLPEILPRELVARDVRRPEWAFPGRLH
jgi:hypothetical protein